jgi:hypothetical protein
MHSPSRRRFLKVGVTATVMLAFARLAERQAAAQGQARGSLESRVLNRRSAELVTALAPVILAGALPDSAESRAIAVSEVVDAMDRAIAGLTPAVQEEVQQLLSLLTFAPTRALLAGVWKPWSQANSAEVVHFLDSWRKSRFELLQSGYQALKQLMQACWYGNPLSWGNTGYPGPPYTTELGL